MQIKNTQVETQHPWPDDLRLIQGGTSGWVFDKNHADGGYGTAFVEVFPALNGFIRGEGPTVPEAETAAWLKYQRNVNCPGHEYEARGYTNGAGFCKHCGQFASNVFTAEQLGLRCDVCGVFANYDFNGDKHFCQEHAPDRYTPGAYGEGLADFLATLAQQVKDKESAE